MNPTTTESDSPAWKKEFDKNFVHWGDVVIKNPLAYKDFISEQVVKKIIDEIPDEYERGVINLPMIKRSLRDKFL